MRSRHVGALLLGAVILLTAVAPAASEGRPRHNVIIVVVDGLRPGAVNPTDAPTMWSLRSSGVDFANSHAVFPTFTTPNAAAIAIAKISGGNAKKTSVTRIRT